MRTLVATLALLVLASCSRDPNVVKLKYFENGNKYFARGRYKEASIMYRNALKKDALYGAAHYKLGLTELKLGRIPQAVAALRRAKERIDPSQADYWDTIIKLADIYLTVSKDKEYRDEAERFANEVLKKDPASYDGHRLSGDLAFIRAQESYKLDRQRGAVLLATAVAEYRKADVAKPNQPPLRMAMARALTASGDYPAAEAVYQSVIAQDKTLTLAYTELYQLFMPPFQRKVEDAEKTLKLAVANNPKQYSLLTMLAEHYFRLRRREDVSRVLQTMKSKSSEFQPAYLVAGDFYLRLGDGDQALKEYREGMAADVAKKLDYQKRMIEVLMRQGKKADAAQINAAILKDHPKDTDARGLAASLLLDKGEVVRAIAELQAVVNAAPGNFVARFHLGRAQMMRGEVELARQQFSEAVKQRPDYILARLALAQLHVIRGEFDGAIKAVQEILAIDPGNNNARLIESAALMGSKRYSDSRQLLQSMLASNPSSPDVMFQMGVVNLAENKFKEAEEAFRKTYQLNPANSRGLMGIVETYMAQNRPDQAMQILQGEAQKTPDRVEFRIALGNTAVRTGKYDLAVSEYQAALQKLDGKSRAAGDLYLRLGETNRRKGDINGAINALQKSRDIMPENPLVVSTLALTLDGAGRKQEARQAYEHALKLEPNNGVALNNLAFLLADNGGDLDQALTYAQKAKQYLPNLLEISDTLGWIYLKKNLSDNAVQIFLDLVGKEPNHSTYRYHLGLALSQKGDRPRAMKELEQALKNNPPKEEAAKIRALMSKLS